MANKPLVIDSRSGLPTGEAGCWTPLANVNVFVRDIITPPISAHTNVGDLVSGIPTAFARADLFKSALDRARSSRSGAASAGGQGLNTYYETLIREWRGLIAALGLDYSKFSVRHIDLAYHDGKAAADTENIYEPTGAFGNMLLERAPLWRPLPKGGEIGQPFINIIKYDGKVVGGTSPETFVFTSTGYQAEPASDRPWVSPDGKFIDPLQGDMSENQTMSLYAFVSHVIDKIGKVQEHFSGLDAELRPNYANIINYLTDWSNEISTYAASRGYDISQASVPPVDLPFDAPFSYIFTFRDLLYGKDGAISSEYSDGCIAFDPKKTLLPKDSEIARIVLDETYDFNPGLIANLPVFVLKAAKKGTTGEYAFFALPLSALGLNVFGRNVGALTGASIGGSGLQSQIEAVYDESATENNLEVTLTLVTNDGRRKPLKESYTVRPDKAIHKKDLLLWPDFISTHWNRYFFYSELPHDVKNVDHPYRAMPFVADKSTDCSCILLDENAEPVYLAKDGVIVPVNDRKTGEPLVKARLLVSADNRVADNRYKYEIYESNLPFKGVRLLSQTQKEGGFLVINYTSDHQKGLPYNGIQASVNLRPADLGIDFGSTNTSVAYYDRDNSQARPIQFRNRRISLLASATDGDTGIPREKHVFFFQSAEIQSNAIKSILTLHDSRRLRVDDEGTETLMLGREVKGGFPSFVSNLPVSDVSESEITLNFPGCGHVKQIHNMKWSEQPIDQSRRRAFLRSLMLHVYAQMFAEGVYPATLKWSYPSAMGHSMLNNYRLIWDDLSNISPATNDEGEPLQMKVFSHNPALTGGFEGEIFGNGSDPFDSDPFGDTSGGFGNNSFGGDAGFGGSPFDAPAQATPAQSTPDSGFGADPFGADPFGADPFSAAPAAAPAMAAAPRGGRKEVDLKPDDPNARIEFNPMELPTNTSLTEACAVANYLMSQNAVGVALANNLTLCFDIGGSTTDFSAIARLKQGPTLIKQNSIHFAAERVAKATAYAPHFKDVLTEACAKFHLTVMGLNRGERNYTPSMAPYYFEQVVDRLKLDQLPTFYNLIAARCPELMAVNLYVTGLITYYAGQIAGKLVREIKNSPDCDWRDRPMVQVMFAGKGARIFEWFSTTNMPQARNYYLQQFVLGMGGPEVVKNTLGGWPFIQLAQNADPNVKYEVSMGLAASGSAVRKLRVPRNEVVIEIIGEEGFTVTDATGTVHKLEPTNGITPEMMRQIGNRFNAPAGGFNNVKCPKFREFAGTFYKFATGCLGFRFDRNIFNQGFENMNIDAYINNSNEFKQAYHREQTNSGSFDYVAPIIILEGMKFYDEYLLPNLNK